MFFVRPLPLHCLCCALLRPPPRAFSVEKEVEWLYAFDVHCNAYIPGFIILHVLQVGGHMRAGAPHPSCTPLPRAAALQQPLPRKCLPQWPPLCRSHLLGLRVRVCVHAQYVCLPLTLSGSFLGVLLGNSLYLVAGVAYIYVAFLGYLGATLIVACMRLWGSPCAFAPQCMCACIRVSVLWAAGSFLVVSPCFCLMRCCECCCCAVLPPPTPTHAAVLPFLHNTTRFLVPVLPLAILYLILVILRVNIVAWSLSVSF